MSVSDATELYRCFLKDTLALIDSIPGVDPVISYTPEGAESYFEGIVRNHHRMLPQRGTDFGQKLCNALEDLLDDGYDSVAIMDSDSPTLPLRYLRLAFELLGRPGARTVLGPALDGGYYLIGLNTRQPRLFQDITWSTCRVLAETIARAGESGLKVELLPEWYDIDDRESFLRLLDELNGWASPADGKRISSEIKREPSINLLRVSALGSQSLPKDDGPSPGAASPQLAEDAVEASQALHTRKFLRSRWPHGWRKTI
ncbi:MAG TPA: TIGR04282 family arsenosugar biosynthesis glycosyltransferase [Blastocatellia bacterium]